MNSIQLKKTIKSNLATVKKQISTTDGFAAWWTADCEVVNDKPGSLCTFNFVKRSTCVILRVQESSASKFRIDYVSDRKMPDWKGTYLEFELNEVPGGTQVVFTHGGFSKKNAYFFWSIGVWEHFLESLRTSVEVGKGDPFTEKPPGRVITQLLKMPYYQIKALLAGGK